MDDEKLQEILRATIFSEECGHEGYSHCNQCARKAFCYDVAVKLKMDPEAVLKAMKILYKKMFGVDYFVVAS